MVAEKDEKEKCPECEGQGFTLFINDDGEEEGDYCQRCEGSGWLTTNQKEKEEE
jgi:hypothetical protein